MEHVAGSVAEYDEASGVGEVADESGRRWFFHCTAIADGSRRIDAGTAVSFDVVPGLLGRWEADQLRPAPRST
ncbi:MAG: cold shock domain-containing protein [Acidimicrobiia bacterium]|nr:cold shock domain-containing protein [Acidimicrobiia bacterium]